jgi:guanylate kinase
VAGRLVATDPSLWLSRSWTTRTRRPGEPDDAYVFVGRDAFEERVAAGGFFEWAEFLGNLYGTPIPDPPDGRDVLLEIDVQGAQQVRRLRPDATLILLSPPSPEIQAARMRARGDDEDHVARRLAAGGEEERVGRSLADARVVNHDLAQATADVAGIVERYRSAARQGGPGTGPAAPPSEPVAEPYDRTEGS